MALLSIPQIASEIGVSECTIRRQIKAGRIPFRKVGKRFLFTQDDVKSYLELCFVAPKVFNSGVTK